MTGTDLVGGPLRKSPSSGETYASFRAIQAQSQQYGPERMALLLHYNQTLLQEVHHRIANSLQLIASIVALDARKVQSQEARRHLEDAHRRILAVATVQRQLQTPRDGGELEVAAYLQELCENLTASVVRDSSRIAIIVHADPTPAPAAFVTDIGLIITELVINALKHAFTCDTDAGRITVSFEVEAADWRLTVADNGTCMSNGGPCLASTGLGSGIVEALVRQRQGHIETSKDTGGSGTSVMITGRFRSP